MAARKQYLAGILHDCTPSELLFVYNTISQMLKRDFIRDLPPELGLHILSFIDDPMTLARASRVSRSWNKLVKDDSMWKRMCELCDYEEVAMDSQESKWGSIPILSVSIRYCLSSVELIPACIAIYSKTISVLIQEIF